MKWYASKIHDLVIQIYRNFYNQCSNALDKGPHKRLMKEVQAVGNGADIG
jgi:hypothetical protein